MKSIRLVFILIATALLSGTSASAFQQIIANPGQLDFGSIEIGRSSMRNVMIQNVGNEDIHYLSVFAMGDSSSFEIMNYCGFLARYSSCMIEVQFFPRTEGSHSAQLQIQGGMANAFVQMSGWGLKQASEE